MWWKKRANSSWSAAFASSKFRTGPSVKNTLRSDPARLIVAWISFVSNASARPRSRSSAVASRPGYGSSRSISSSAARPADRDRVPAERPRLVHGADRCELLHQGPATAERRAREPTAHHLAEHREVG